jgi:Site-specific recombinase XerD
MKTKSILKDFPEMIEDYLIDLEIRNYSLNTIKIYKSILDNFYRFLTDEENSDKNILRSFKRYIRYLKRDKRVSQNYIYLVTIVVKKFFEFHKMDHLKDVKTPKRAKSLPKSLNEDEVKRLIRAVDTDTRQRKFTRTRDKLILSLLYSSGLRVSEVVSLKVNDIDLKDRTIRIRGKGNKDRIVLFDQKTKNYSRNTSTKEARKANTYS